VLQTPVATRWGRLDVQTQAADGQTVIVESRSGNTAVPDATWSGWESLTKEWSEVTSPPATYAQFRVRMAGAGPSPSLSYARLFYFPTNQAPMIKLQAPTKGDYLSGKEDIRWRALDPDGDELTYTVLVSADNGKTWAQLKSLEPNGKKTEGDVEKKPALGEDTPPQVRKPADEVRNANKPAAGKPDAKAEPKAKVEPTKATEPRAAKNDAAVAGGEDEKPAEKPEKPKNNDKELRASSIPWDTKTTKDGVYLVRVQASDKFARPTDPKSVEITSGAVTVDNTTPTITLDDKIYGWDQAKQFIATDNLSPIVGGKYRINDGTWTALVAADGVFNRRQEALKMVGPGAEVVLTKGDYKVQIQIWDAAGNLLDRTVTVLSGQQPPAPTPVVYLPVDGEAGDADVAMMNLLLDSLNNE